MASATTLHEAFVDELRDMYNAEKQITKALPKMVKAASSEDLSTAFEEHLQQTQTQVERLEQVFESIDEKPRSKQCQGMAGILEEGSEILNEDMDEAMMDARLIAAAQRVEHYEMAAYGTLVAWARMMGHDDAARLLEETLNEEKAADEKLTNLAEGGINQHAAEGGMGEGEEMEEEKPAGRTSRTASTGQRNSRKRAATR